MQDVTYNHLNTMMNQINQLGAMYKALKYAFKFASFKGYYKFCKNEAMERWELGSDIAKYLCTHNRQPKLMAIPEQPQDKLTPPAALETMLNRELQVINTIDAAIKAHAAGNVDMWVLGKMSCIYEKCIYEKKEIEMVKDKLGLPGADIFSVDSWLYDMYGRNWYKK